jgi:hypothetical protein
LAYGDTWTWTAIEADSKLIISWLVGGRDAKRTMKQVAEGAMKRRAQRIATPHSS